MAIVLILLMTLHDRPKRAHNANTGYDLKLGLNHTQNTQ
jgi:hypothetical protein